MNLIHPLRLLGFHKNALLLMSNNVFSVRNYAITVAPILKSKKALKKTQTLEKVVFPAEQDVDKLMTYCCGSNIYVEGEDVKLKPDSEYPDWLWTVYVGPKKPASELDPNTKEYWRRLREEGLRRNNHFAKYKKR